MNLRAPELQLVDLLIPWNVGVGSLGFLISLLITTLLERADLLRFVWHPPLFFLGLLILVTCVLGLFLHP